MKGKLKGMLLLLSLLTAVLGIICFYSASVLLLTDIKREALTQIGLVQEIVLASGADYNEIVDRCSLHTGNRITLLTKDGLLLADSARDQVSFQSFQFDKEMILARRDQIGSSILVSPLTGRNTLNMAGPGRTADSQEIIIRVACDLSSYDSTLRSLWYCSGFALLTGGLAALAAARRHYQRTRPANQAVARYVEAVDANQPPQWREEDGEVLRRLAVSVNRQLGHNEALLAGINRKFSQINTILSSMDDGLLAVDNGNRIVLFNPQAAAMVGLDGRAFFSEAPVTGLMAAQVLEGTAAVIASGQAKTVTLEGKDSTLLEVVISPIVNKYIPYDDFGALAVLKDVTRVKELEVLRSEFVANVSHELRTPLTLIGGFVETLKENDELTGEEKRRALEIVGIETDRLRKLISQLLSLSHIENNLLQRDMQPVDLGAVLLEAADAATALAQAKGIELELRRVPRRLPPVTGNATWMRQILLNLTENAIKYSAPCGKVRIKLSAGERGVSLSVKDNGPGIPKPDLDRVFERFYRVDKSRNSQEGGSGLGLAIVKHMVTEMGGEIQARSRVGKGSEFIAIFPTAQPLKNN